MTWWQRLRMWFRLANPHEVSAGWLDEQALRDTKQGWEGPRWRLPRERQR